VNVIFNLRPIRRGCCGVCKYGFYSDAMFCCRRIIGNADGGALFTVGDFKEYEYICGGFKFYRSRQ